MTLIIEGISKQEFFATLEALKFPVLKTTEEVKHEPVTIAYAARDLDVCPATIYRWINEKKLIASRGKSGWEIDFASLAKEKQKIENAK